MDPRCYAARRLNPFLGVVQVLETPTARAITVDGLNWQIQVRAERPEHTWGSLNQHSSETQFFRFGFWTEENGLSRVPVNPILDVGAMLAAADQLTESLRQNLSALPFPLEDRFELWLMDGCGQPLALLASSVEERFMGEIKANRWQANRPIEHGFSSPSLLARGQPAQQPQSPRRHAELLEDMVQGRAGAGAPRQWYLRQPDGGGLPCAGGDSRADRGEELTGAAFPPLTLSELWPEPGQTDFVKDYIDWLAPRLLTLTDLSNQARRRLEQAARNQALAVEENFALYPKVIDHALIDAARVEARIRRSNSTA